MVAKRQTKARPVNADVLEEREDGRLGRILAAVALLLPIGVLSDRMKNAKTMPVCLMLFMGVAYFFYGSVPMMGQHRMVYFFIFLAMTAGMSTPGLPAPAMPNSAARRTVSSASAEDLSVLVGMQPQLRHVPPSHLDSTSVTSAPRLAASKAAV